MDMAMLDEAIKVFDETIKIDPNDAEAWFYKGMALIHSAKQMEAYRAFIEATEINPGYADAWFQKGVILAKTGK